MGHSGYADLICGYRPCPCGDPACRAEFQYFPLAMLSYGCQRYEIRVKTHDLVCSTTLEVPYISTVVGPPLWEQVKQALDKLLEDNFCPSDSRYRWFKAP